MTRTLLLLRGAGGSFTLHRLRRGRQHALTRKQPQARITKTVLPQVRDPANSRDYRDPIGASLTGQACRGERPIASRPRALALIEEPDGRMERGQAACQRTLALQLLQGRTW